MQKVGAKRKPKTRIIDDDSDEDAYEPSAKKVCILIQFEFLLVK